MEFPNHVYVGFLPGREELEKGCAASRLLTSVPLPMFLWIPPGYQRVVRPQSYQAQFLCICSPSGAKHPHRRHTALPHTQSMFGVDAGIIDF